MAASVSGSLRDVQQALLWSISSLACFNGTIEKQRLVIRWNSSLRKLFQLSAARAPQGGPLFNHLVVADDRLLIERACDALISTGKPLDSIFRVHIDGAVKSLRVVAERLDQSSRVTGLLQEYQGTPQQEAIIHISQNRWQSVGRLTLLDEVASAMAHELNQPLAAIATFAQAGERLLNLPEPRLEKARQVFVEVSHQALRAGELIRHMRSLIRRYSPSKTQLSLTELIKGFVQGAEPIARTHHIELNLSKEIPQAFVCIDVAQINQVLMILFQNAVDEVTADNVQSRSISVTTTLKDGKVLLAINDSGKGISPEAEAHMFQPFASTKENGTGLGLISARNILETYGSHLEYTNLPQGGCSFWFSLHLVDEK